MEFIIQQITLELAKNILKKFKITHMDLNQLGELLLRRARKL